MGGEQKLLPVRECGLKGLLGQVIHINLVGRGEDIARDELLRGMSSDRAKPVNPPSFPGAFPHSLSERPPFPAASASSASKVQASQGGIAAGGDVTVTAQPGGTAFIQTGEGKIVITNIQGINPAEHQKLAKQLGVTEAALGNFFKILEQKEVPPEEHILAEYLNLQGKASIEGGHYVDAQQPFERALVLREQALGSDYPDLAQSLNNLAELYRTQGQYGKAEPLYQCALRIREKALGPKHPHIAIALA
jgi:hypothetical protein